MLFLLVKYCAYYALLLHLVKIFRMTQEDLLGVAKEFGAPVYVYDAEKIKSQYNRLTTAFSGVSKLKLNYAAKALSNISILRLMNSLGSGLDTVSIQEVQLGLKAGFKPSDIIFTPNGVSLEELETAAGLGVRINIDNLSLLEQFGSKHAYYALLLHLIKILSMTQEDLLGVAKEFGAPVYVYDAEKIKSQYNRLTNAFSGVSKLKLNYAAKALSNISILRLMNSLGSGLDTVSIQEVQLGLKAGFKPSDIIFTPNGVSLEELETAASLGVRINIDNLSLLEQFGNKHPEIPVCIRINPHVMAGGNANISVGHIDSKFGISIHQIPHILRITTLTKMNINGIHMHTGSDILDIEVFLYASEILFETAKNFKNLDFIDFGSGFKVPYKEGDIETNIEELGDKLSKRFNDFCEQYGKPLTLAFEPGKFLVSEAGSFLAKVNVVKQTTSTVFASIDSGFNHLIRPMLYGSTHGINNISNPSGRERFYSVVGYICETDTFATNRKIAEITEGDILCFKNAGAYCFTMASNYNSRFRPAEVLWYMGEAHLIRAAETMEDIMRNQIDVKDLFSQKVNEVLQPN